MTAISLSEAHGRNRAQKVAMVVMLAVLLAAPFFVYPYFLMQALCFALLACAFNLLVGYVGLLSFGHAMFMGTGAYICAHLAQARGVPVEFAIPAGMLVAALVGVVAGALSIRRQGIYFSMTTLALSQLIYFLALELPFTHGEDGIQPVPQTKIFGGLLDLGHPLQIYYFVLVIFFAGFLLIYRVINSPFGEVLKSIRENEPRAISLGYKVDQYKLMAFVLSATLAGLAGATKALVVQNASLSDVYWTTSGEIVLMTLVGGMGTIFGPVIGAFIVSAMQVYLSGLGQWVTVIQGVIFVTCVLAFRRGIVGEIAAKFGLNL
ncbi:MAG: branched-chain amino acid ABC transporter permease [Hyphomicrobiales bacterium]|nr:branched-chain amino acid ABC transporter permease [Hyphomicrobiales bacterium]